jgi:HEAT repeat protein
MPTLLPTLRQLLQQETDPLVGLTIARALAASGDATGLAYLKTKLNDEEERVRDAVAGLLGTLEDPTVASLLRTAFALDPSTMVRTTAAASLMHFKDPRGLPLLQQALDDVDFRIRLGVAIALSRMDYNTAKPLVVRALQSEDPLVRTNAFKVVGENLDHSAASMVVDAVAKEDDRYVKSQALWTLGRIGDARAVPLLIDLLTEEREEVRHSSAEALVMISDRLLQERR